MKMKKRKETPPVLQHQRKGKKKKRDFLPALQRPAVYVIERPPSGVYFLLGFIVFLFYSSVFILLDECEKRKTRTRNPGRNPEGLTHILRLVSSLSHLVRR